MSKYERRIFFDRLVGLRDGYQRSEREATSMNVEQAIAYAMDLFDKPERLDAILAESDDSSTDTAADTFPTPHSA